MNPKIKTKWIKALRSGKYKKGIGALRPTPKTYCCLGVLCDIYAKETKQKWTKESITREYGFDHVTDLLPFAVQEWAGVDSEDGVYNGHSLSKDNDGEATGINIKPKSFRQIAKIIKEKF